MTSFRSTSKTRVVGTCIVS